MKKLLKILKFTKKNKIDEDLLYQSKFDYYKVLNLWTIILTSLSEITYFISDCQLFDRFAWETLIPRCAILIPMFLFIKINQKCSNYKIMVPISYITVHCSMWCTIWAIYYLPIKTHASEGFIIMHLMFVAVGLCAPPKYSIPFHTLVITNILFSNNFNHYENLDIMLSLGLPCLIGIEALLLVLNKVYKEHYLIKTELEKNVYLDQLTQIYNRKIITTISNTETNCLNITNAYFIILDIDFFKKINDTYGHENGDKVLSSLVKSISKNISEKDYLIRWGGEEFLIIIPYKNYEEINEIAKKIKNSIINDDNGVCNITVSMGIDKYNGGDYHKTILKADEALYFAKNNGRNQYKFFKEES